MGKLPEHNRTKNEQSEVNTKIPEIAAMLWRHMVIKTDNDPGLYNSDSSVVLESNQIQDLPKPRNNFPSNSLQDCNPASEFCLAW